MKTPKRALITGIWGQDGSYLCQLLHQLGYQVFGLARKTLSENAQRNRHFLQSQGINPTIYHVDLTDYEALKSICVAIQPDEIYHLAAFHVSSQAKQTGNNPDKALFDHNVKVTSNILGLCYACLPDCKVVTAGSCLMYDDSPSVKQNEDTPFASDSLYGLAKISEQQLVNYYRNRGLHASMAILFNHESSRRPDAFVTKKIIKNLVACQKGEIEQFTLGHLGAEKDWGYAKDYVYGMYLMAQQPKASDFVLASGQTHTIEYFLSEAARQLGLSNWASFVHLDHTILTRKIRGQLVGDASRAYRELGWRHTLTLPELIGRMIQNELENDLK